MKEKIKIQKKDISIISLIAVNLFPIGGILFWGWNVEYLIFSYWVESLIICFYTLLKILKVAPLHLKWSYSNWISWEWFGLKGRLLILTLLFFFIIPILVFSLPVYISLEAGILLAKSTIWFLIWGLLISHGISFFVNFLGKMEFERIDPVKLFILPYPRLIIMRIGIIGGVIISSIGWFPWAIWPAILLVIFKTIFDIIGHIREHKKYNSPTIPSNAIIIECHAGEVMNIRQDLENNKMTLDEIQKKYANMIKK